METIPEGSVAMNSNAATQNSQTAADYINEQLVLEADAKEILPYKFDKCTYDLGPLRQSVFACLTCSPPPASAAQRWTPAGVCYSCSISCHGDHTLVELFKRRNFVCDCGTTRFTNSSPCTLRSDSKTGQRGVSGQEPAKTNTYNQNYKNHFCGCGEDYDANTEKGTMYQCIGLGSVDTGGCGEDWWHPECLMGLPRDWYERRVAKSRPKNPEAVESNLEPEHPVPEGFPEDDTFTTLICYKCVEANPWVKQYAGTDGFLQPVFKQSDSAVSTESKTAAPSLKRKASDDEHMTRSPSPTKRLREDEKPSALLAESNTATLEAEDTTLYPGPPDAASDGAALPSASASVQAKHKHDALPPPPQGTFSILAKEDFREKLCHCPACFPNLIPHLQLQEEEDEYEPSISDSEQSNAGGSATRSVGTGSLLERGEAALSNVDRVRAIEGVMVYNHLKDKVKEFLKPYAESGQAVSADDIKGYFEKLRGDQDAVKEASQKPVPAEDDNRREQSGY